MKLLLTAVVFFSLSLCFLLPGCLNKDNEAGRFQKFLDEEWEYAMQEYPTWATSVGWPGQNHRWSDISLPAFSRRDLHKQDALKRILDIDKTKLGKNDRLNYELYLRDLKLGIEWQRFDDKYLRIDQMGGIQKSISDLFRRMPASTSEDFNNILTRFKTVPLQIDNTIILLEEGFKNGITPPRVTLRDVPDQIKAITVATDNPIMKVFKSIPKTIPEEKQKSIEKEAQEILVNLIIPAYEKLYDFFVNIYMPGARDTIGWCDLPDGKEWYTLLVKDYTTTDMSPEEIHNMGLSEVKRIRGQIEILMKETGFKGTYKDFNNFMLNDSSFVFNSADDLVMACRDIAKRADYQLPKLFRKLPRLPYGVLPVPAYAEKSQPAAYFQSGNLKNGIAGTFFVNTYNLPSRPKWGLTPLVLHEAVPGHHLQIALANEQGDLPNFRRYGGYTAYVEGWALYAETLGYKMGMYEGNYLRFGQLNFELWRAIRLVVDTGIHWYGWSRQSAIDYFKDNMANSEHNIIVEVDRYIVMPGQALTYKIGQLKIKEYRDFCVLQMGERFDIRAFHDYVLEQGALPMDVLEHRVKEWVSKKIKK